MATIQGNALANVLTGTSVRDLMYGRDGNDTINGLGGGDYINGGNGNDRICGDAGDDLIHAGTGADVVFGGDGSDSIHGDDGNDYIETGTGQDNVYGGAGNDVIKMTGDDQKFIEAGDGDDFILFRARDMDSSFNNISIIGGGEGFDTIEFIRQGFVDGKAAHTTILKQTDSDSFHLSYVTDTQTDTAAKLTYMERFDFRALPNGVVIDFNPEAGSEFEFVLSPHADRMKLDGAGFISVERFQAGEDVLELRAPQGSVSVTYDGSGATLETGDMTIKLAGVTNLAQGTDWIYV